MKIADKLVKRLDFDDYIDADVADVGGMLVRDAVEVKPHKLLWLALFGDIKLSQAVLDRAFELQDVQQ